MSRTQGASDFGVRRLLTDRTALVLLIGLAIVGVALLAAGEETGDHTHPIWRAILLNVGGLFVASATLSFLWELRGKRSFAQEVLAAAGVAADVRKAGLKAIEGDYLRITDWSQLFANATEIDLFASWGATWRRTYEKEWNDWIAQRTRRVRVLLPDATNDALVTHLARRFDKSEAYVRERIIETSTYYASLRKRSGEGTLIDVRHLDRAPVWSYYRLGATIVAALYPQSLASAPEVPAMVFAQSGQTGQFFADQFDSCWEEADKGGT